MAEAVCKDYEASLRDLKINSKPHINMLTMLADENKEHAAHIVPLIERRMEKAKGSEKLPIIYLVDSIIKNVKGGPYLALFSKNIVKNFSLVFEQGDEKIRTSLFKLRSTWNEYFGNEQLYGLDIRVKEHDPAWPVMATPAALQQPTVLSPSIHINPRFIKKQPALQPARARPQTVKKRVVQQPPAKQAAPAPAKDDVKDLQMKEQKMRSSLVAKQQELLQIHKQRLELELQQTKARLHEQALELERKNLELQRQKILQQQQQQVFAAQAQLTTSAMMMPPSSIMRPSSVVTPSPAVPRAPVVTPASIVAPAPVMTPAPILTAAAVATQAVAVTSAPTTTPVASVAPRSSASQAVAAKSNYNAASAGWGSTQVTPPQPGSEQAKSFGTKRDPRTAARRDPRSARDPRLKSAATASVQPNVVEDQPKTTADTNKVPTHPVKPIGAKEQQKQAVKPAPSSSTTQSKARPAIRKDQQQARMDPRLKGKPAQLNKAVVPPLKREEPPAADNGNLTRQEAEVESLDLIAISDDEGSPEVRSKKESGIPQKEGPRDGSRSPRGKSGNKGEKRKDSDPSRGRSDRPRRSSHRSRSKSRSRSPPRRSTRYNTRSGRRRGSDERERVEKERDRRDRRDERDHRERRDISKLGRIPKKSDTKKVEERRTDLASKRKSPPRDRKGPEVDPGKMEPGAEMASKRGRFERLDLLERFPDRGLGFERSRGMQPGSEGRERPHYEDEMVPPSQRRRRSSIDPSVVIPKELSRDKISAILAQVDRQLHFGQISQEEHGKLLGQLDDLYQFQKTQEEALNPPGPYMGGPHIKQPLMDTHEQIRPLLEAPRPLPDRPLPDKPPLDRSLVDTHQPKRPHLEKPLLDRPPMDQPLIDRTDIYNYRLRGGIIEKEALEKELPESDDSFFMEVARKTQIQERMAVPQVTGPSTGSLQKRPEPPPAQAQENPFGFPVNEDVDLRMLDPNYQEMLQQKRAEEEKKVAESRSGPVKESPSEPVWAGEVVLSKEAVQSGESSLPKDIVSSKNVVIPKEVVLIEKAVLHDKVEIKKDEEKNIAIRDTQEEQKLEESVKEAVSNQPSPKTKDTSKIPRIEDKPSSEELLKDSLNDAIMISPMSPPPEDRDERHTAVVGQKNVDAEPKVEGKPGGEKTMSAVEEQKVVDDRQKPLDDHDERMDVLKEDVDDRLNTSENDSDERNNVVKREVEVELVGRASDKKELAVADIDDRTMKGNKNLKKLEVRVTDIRKRVNVADVQKDIDDRKDPDVKEVENLEKVDVSIPKEGVDSRGEPEEKRRCLGDRKHADNRDVDYRKAGVEGKKMINRDASESDVDERICQHVVPEASDSKKPTTMDDKKGATDESKVKEGLAREDKGLESKDVDLRVSPSKQPAAVVTSLKNEDIDERKPVDAVFESKDVDIRVAVAAHSPSKASSEKKDVDERKPEEHASGSRDVDLRVRVTEQPSAGGIVLKEGDAENVEMEVGPEVSDVKQDVDQRGELAGQKEEEIMDVHETAPDNKVTKTKRKRLNKGKGKQMRIERRRKTRMEKLSQKKEEFLKTEYLKNELLKEESLKQERLKREREKEEQLKLEHLQEVELEAAAAEKERMLRALEQKKKAAEPPKPLPAGDDLLPAAFRDAVEPSATDQDLRDVDARMPGRDHPHRAKSWSEVPNNFFDVESKRFSADVTGMKQDVDLRNLGPRFKMGREPPNAPNLPPGPHPDLPPRLQGPIPHGKENFPGHSQPWGLPEPYSSGFDREEDHLGRRDEEWFGREHPHGEFQERYGSRGPAPRTEGRPPMSGPRGPAPTIEGRPPMLRPRGPPPRMEERPSMHGPRGPSPHPQRHRGPPPDMGPEPSSEEMLARRLARGPQQHSREGSPLDEDPRGGMPRHRQPPTSHEFDERLPRHRMSRREAERRRHYKGDHPSEEFMDTDPQFYRDRGPLRDARMEELRMPMSRGGPMIGEHSPRNSPRHLPEHGQESPPPPLARMEEQNPYLMERDDDLRHPPVRRGNEGPPMLVKEQPVTSMPYDPFQPSIAPQPGQLPPVRIPIDGPSGPQQIVLIPPKGMEGMPLHLRMPGQPNIVLIPIRPNMPGQPNIRHIPGQPHMQPMPGQPHMQPMPGPPRMVPPIQEHIPPRPQLIPQAPGPRFIPPPELQGITQGEHSIMQGIPSGQPFPTYVPTPQPVRGPPMSVQPELPKNEPLPESNLKSQVDINDLLKKLMTSGILTKPQSSVHGAGTRLSAGDKDSAPQETKNGKRGVEPPGKCGKGRKKGSAKGTGKKAKKVELKQEEERDGEGADEVKKEPRVGLPEELTLPQEKLVVPPLQLGSSDLKQRIPGVIHSIISGTQCSSCGMRFSIEHMDDYRKHLDWHFRLNRRDKDGVKSVTWRRWFYGQDEWMLYEEIDASEDGCRSSFFDQQATDPATDTDQEKGVPVTGVEEDEYCKICQEPFEQYWDEDDEAWMLREAIKINGKTYHPACYGDLTNSSAIFEEPSGEFQGIPGVTEDALPGLDSVRRIPGVTDNALPGLDSVSRIPGVTNDALPGLASVSNEMKMEQDGEWTAGTEVEEAKMKLAEILKPPKTEVKIAVNTEPGTEITGESKAEIEIKTEPGTEVSNESKTESETSGLGLDAGALPSGLDSKADAPQIKSEPEDVKTDSVVETDDDVKTDVVKTEEVVVKSEILENQPEPAEISDTAQEALRPSEGIASDSKPDRPLVGPLPLETLKVKVPEDSPPEQTTAGDTEMVDGAAMKQTAEGGSTPTQDEIPTPTEEMAMDLPPTSAEPSISVDVSESGPLGVMSQEPVIIPGNATWIGEGNVEIAPHRTEPGIVGGVMMGSGFPGEMDDDESGGFSRIFVDFIDDDDDLPLMPLGGVSTDFQPEPFVQPVDGAFIYSQGHVMDQTMEGPGVSSLGIQSEQGEPMEVTSSDQHVGPEPEMSASGQETVRPAVLRSEPRSDPPATSEQSAIVPVEESPAAAREPAGDQEVDSRTEEQASESETAPADEMTEAVEPGRAKTNNDDLNQDTTPDKNTAPAGGDAEITLNLEISGAAGSSTVGVVSGVAAIEGKLCEKVDEVNADVPQGEETSDKEPASTS